MYTQTAILLLLSVLVLGFVKLQQGDKPRIPSATSPNGKITRAVLWALLIALVGYFVFGVILGGTSTIASTITTILIMVVLAIRIWGKSSNK